MDYWQKAPVNRRQQVLIATMLDDRIPLDHPVRLLDEILAGHDWTSWEAHYHGRLGQPPIHPQVLAAAILYGLIRRIRSSRQLEYAINHSIDFMWLVSGRSIDHSTLCEFRTKFKKELKTLYRHVCRIAAAMGLIRLMDVAVDGTRVRSQNGRHKTWNQKQIEALLDELERQCEQQIKQAELEDSTDALLLDDGESLDRLPPDLADLRERQVRLRELLRQAQEADQARRREGIDPEKNPAQIPRTDPDSRVLPNKEGGYAPNYTPVTAVDAEGGFIVSTAVLADTAEQTAVVPLLEDIHETFGEYPQAVSGDGVYATGETLVALDARDVELFSPLPGPDIEAENPAEREDPTQPVAAEERERLPINPQTKRFDKSSFVYDEQADRYYCPEGRPLDYEETKSETRRGQRVTRRVYRSADCSGCPLIDQCHKEGTQRGRSVSRDIHEKRRREHARKMATAEAKARYAKRFHTAEVPFALIKEILNLRRFLLRGLPKVETEWLWSCTAHNLNKLMRAVARLRAEFSKIAMASV
jgi:transposase